MTFPHLLTWMEVQWSPFPDAMVPHLVQVKRDWFTEDESTDVAFVPEDILSGTVWHLVGEVVVVGSCQVPHVFGDPPRLGHDRVVDVGQSGSNAGVHIFGKLSLTVTAIF